MQRNGFFMMRGRVPLLGMAMAAAGAGAWLKAFLVTVFGPFFVEKIPYSQAFLLEDALKVMQLHCTRSAVHGLVSYLEWANLPHRTPARTLPLCLLAPDMKFTLIAPSSTSIFSTSIFSTSIFSTSSTCTHRPVSSLACIPACRPKKCPNALNACTAGPRRCAQCEQQHPCLAHRCCADWWCGQPRHRRTRPGARLRRGEGLLARGLCV